MRNGRCAAFAFRKSMKQPDDPTPLSILVEMMREKWAAGDREGALGLARFSAPYLHRRNPIRQGAATSDPVPQLHRLSDAELEDWIRSFGGAQGASSGEGPTRGDPKQSV